MSGSAMRIRDAGVADKICYLLGPLPNRGTYASCVSPMAELSAKLVSAYRAKCTRYSRAIVIRALASSL